MEGTIIQGRLKLGDFSEKWGILARKVLDCNSNTFHFV